MIPGSGYRIFGHQTGPYKILRAENSRVQLVLASNACFEFNKSGKHLEQIRTSRDELFLKRHAPRQPGLPNRIGLYLNPDIQMSKYYIQISGIHTGYQVSSISKQMWMSKKHISPQSQKNEIQRMRQIEAMVLLDLSGDVVFDHCSFQGSSSDRGSVGTILTPVFPLVAWGSGPFVALAEGNYRLG